MFIFSLFIGNAVDWLSGHMKGRYCSMRLKKYEEEKDPWPPIKTKSYVTLAIVHQKELQTRQETTATIYLRTKGDIHKIPHTIGTEKLTDITQIFDPLSGRVPNSILIEGHAGIGKTTLVKQICIQWAEGKLLTSDKLVLLLLLRDPNVQKITNEHQLIEHFTKSTSKVEQLYSYLEDNHGADITLIIDGFDELSTQLRYKSFFRELIEKRCLPNARIVVTSRPSASACLHQVVDKRIEILGFEQSSKNQYVIEALQDHPSKVEKLQRHFQQYPNIDAICYIPLIMSIIVFLCMCQPDELPPTATKMYESFILHTICHYLKRVGKTPEGLIINKLEQFPPVVSIALQDLGKTAFDGLVDDKIVFTVKELPVFCWHDPTCYGLLQSTECYSAEEIGTSAQSFNFLHLGIQEYFAAKYVTTLPEDEVYTLLKESFIVTDNEYSAGDSKSVRLSNMWILYCGITSGQCKTLRHYLTTYGKSDNISAPKLPPATPMMSLQPSSVNPSYHPVTPPTQPTIYSRYPLTPSRGQHIASYPHSYHLPTQHQPVHFSTTTSMSGPSQQGSSSNQKISNIVTISQDVLKDPVKVLYLFQCFQEAQDNKLCEILSRSFDSDVIDINDHRLLPHQVVSLGFFLSRSHRKWNKLLLIECHIGDRGMNIIHQYLCGSKQKIAKIYLDMNDLTGASSHLIADIISHLQTHTLVLRDNNITNVRYISTAVVTTSTVKVLSMRSNDLTAQEAGAISDMMICLEELYINDNKLGDHGAELLSEGITNTKTLRVLNISRNNIGPSGTTAIANALANNTSLEKLYMSGNAAGQDGAIALGNAITNNKTIKELLLADQYDYDVTVDKESAMIIIKSLYNNNTITKLSLDITLHKKDANLITEEAEKVKFTRKLSNNHIIDLTLYFNDSQGQNYGGYTTEHKLLWYR